MVRKFTPKNASMTDRQIADMVNMEIESHNECADAGDFGNLAKRINIKIVAKNIPDKLAQWFVNAEFNLRDEYIDEAEENFVMARIDLCLKLAEKMERLSK